MPRSSASRLTASSLALLSHLSICFALPSPSPFNALLSPCVHSFPASPHPLLLYVLPPFPSFPPFISPFICHSLLLLPLSLSLSLSLSHPPSTASVLVCEWWVCGVLVISSTHPDIPQLGSQTVRQNDKRRPERRRRLTARQLPQQD